MRREEGYERPSNSLLVTRAGMVSTDSRLTRVLYGPRHLHHAESSRSLHMSQIDLMYCHYYITRRASGSATAKLSSSRSRCRWVEAPYHRTCHSAAMWKPMPELACTA